uniref:Uncharacterized protein n=1 Tax=Tanacetum cinerariifolium TaxID=118510 RepID=A0A6L2JFC2_TANCI|nr:hypothetical protein [Tanacetum cinerariifolium]
MVGLPLRAQRHLYLRYKVEGYIEEIIQDYKQRLATIFSKQVNRVHILDFAGLTKEIRQGLTDRLRMVYTGAEGKVLFTSHVWISDTEMRLDIVDTMCFQLGGAKCSMTWRQFILALGLHTAEEMARDGFEAYWLGSTRAILDKGGLRAYCTGISSDSPVIHQPPQELSIPEIENLKQQYLDELKRLSNLEYRDEIKIAELKENFNVTPVLSTEEPDNSLSMGDEYLDTIPATKSDEFIKSSVENLIPIPNQFEDFSKSNEEFSSIDDDSFSIDDIDYVEASPLDSELVSSEVMEIVILEVGGIDDDILLTIKDDILHEKLLNVNLLISKIEALNVNLTPSSDCKTKSSSTSLNSLLEETNTFDNSLPKFETFCFDVEEISSGSTTTPPDISLLKYEVFYDDHVKEISSGSTTTPPDISLLKYEVFYDDHVKEISSGSSTTHFDSSLYASFIFDLSINPFTPTDRSDSYEFTDEIIPFISAPEYDCFLFKVEPNSRDFTKDVVEDISPTKEPQVLNTLPTHPTLQLNMKFQHSSEYLFTYVVWIFLPFLVYSVAPHYLLCLRNEDAIFDLSICNSTFSRPDISYRDEGLIGLTVIARELPVIDMDELVTLRICDRLYDTRAWVAPSPERQQVAVAEAPEGVEGASIVDEGRMTRLEEEVHGLRESLDEQHEVMDAMARDFSRFTVWAASGISQLLDLSRATYTRYSKTHVPYQRRRVRQRTDGASTSAP